MKVTPRKIVKQLEKVDKTDRIDNVIFCGLDGIFVEKIENFYGESDEQKISHRYFLDMGGKLVKNLDLNSPPKLVLVGEAASGKSWIKENLGLVQDKSYVTRERRPSDDDGYIFVSEEIFKNMIHSGQLLQYNKKETKNSDGLVISNFYGTSIISFLKSEVMIMDPIAVSELPSFIRKNIKVIYVDVDNETKQNRLQKRNWTKEQIDKRNQVDDYLFANFINFDLKIKSEDSSVVQKILDFRNSSASHISTES